MRSYTRWRRLACSAWMCQAVWPRASRLCARVDVWSPHAFVEAFLDKYTTFRLGDFEDASEALQYLLDGTPALKALFLAAPGELSDTLIELPRFSDTAEDGISPQPFLADTPLQSLDMPRLLTTVLSGARAPIFAPELLAIRVPQFWEREDGARYWLTGCGITPCWGPDARVLFSNPGQDIAYRLRSYIEYSV